MHQHLYAAAAQATVITPATARLIGWALAALIAILLLNKVFGKSDG